LLQSLAKPNVASKHWIIRQYDHEVQGGSVIKPLVGPQQIGPSDASVIRPKLNSFKGIAIGCGLVPHVADPYRMAVAAIDEAIRNVICVGASLDKLALLDNFCWPSVDDEQLMGTLVRACEACRDAALAFGTPFISGKDSLHNQFTDSETGRVTKIPATLLISAIGVIDDVRRCTTMDFKQPGSSVYLVSAENPDNLTSLAQNHRAVEKLIASGQVLACHDVSDDGIMTAIAEMCIASGLGVKLQPEAFEALNPWSETPGRYLIEIGGGAERANDLPSTARLLGFVQQKPQLELAGAKELDVSVAQMTAAWRGTLDW
jgi:phosphoribosylformylglycinamidine synthase